MASDSEPVRENNQAPNTEGKTNKQPDHAEIPVQPITAPKPERQPAKYHCEITCKTEKNWWSKTKPYVEIAGVLLLAVYTAYTIKIFCATKRATEATGIAATAAKNAADAAKISAGLAFNEQRPFVFVKMVDNIKVEIGKRISAPVEVFNYGKFPAMARTVIHIEVGPNVIETFRSKLAEPHMNYLFIPEEMGTKQILISPGEGRKDFPVESLQGVLSRQDYEKIMSGVAAGTMDVAVYGRIFYSTLGVPVHEAGEPGVTYDAAFCFYMMKDGTTSACTDNPHAYTNFEP